MQETKRHPPEYLSKDILDDEFVATFKMVLRIQYLLGSCRLDVKDRFVTAPTNSQKAYTIFCIIITLILSVIIINLYYDYSQSGAVYSLTAFSVWYGFGAYAAVVINARFCNGKKYAEFFVQMQKVDRLMGLDKIEGVNEILKGINQFSLIMLLLAFIPMSIVVLSTLNIVFMSFAGTVFGLLTEMIELIFCSNLIVYFFVRVRFINCIIKNHLRRHKATVKTPSKFFLSYRHLKGLASHHDFVDCDTHAYLKQLFDMFTTFQNLYRFQLLMFCFKLVIESLVVFGLVMFSIQKSSVNVIEVAAVILFELIDIFIAIFMGMRLQMFYAEIKETKRLSIAVMAEYSNGPLRVKASKMLKMAEETPPRLSVYDMYYMDAGIFLSIFGLVTSLIVTLLQFALL